jgi:hypothetical protein
MPLGNIFGVQFIVSQASSNLFDNACLLDENGDAILQEDGTSCIIMENANGASAPPVIEGIPVVLGVPNEGQTLIATSDTITGFPTPTVSWQWESSADGSTGWTSISGATSSSYVVQPSDTGNYLRVVQTATNNQGSDTASSVSSSVPLGLPFNSTSPAVSGTAELGQTLSTTDGTWVGVPTITFAYQWRRDGIDISGANSSTYALVTIDYDTDIDCVVTASNSLGNVDAESNTVENIAGITPVISGVPTISGVIELGEVVTATLASVSGDPAPVNSLQWQVSNDGISGWSDISGETSTTYTIVSSDENKYLRVVQTSTNGQGTDTASSTSTSVVLGLPFNLALPFASGSAQVDQVLSTTDGTWQGVSTIVFSYQWRRDGIDINGATSSTYTLTASDYTTDIDCVVTATNSLGSVNQDSNDITNIAGASPVISGVPTISGTAKVDEVLTATSASVSGTPTPTSTLQWEVSNDGVSGWSAISGATSSTYTVLSSDEGKYLRVVQTETNVIGSDTANSVATAQVAGLFTGLLDDYSGAAAAYSLRLLDSSYSGNAIKVRRASDNTEQDIGFVNNELDTSSLEAFCSGTDGFVTTWYDQSGNANNASQTTAASQPKIVSSGTTIALNGKPSINGDAVEDSFELGTSIGLSSEYSIFQVNQVLSTNTYGLTISSVGTSSASGIFVFDGLVRFKVDGTNYSNSGASGNKGSQRLWSGFRDSSDNLESYRNSSVYGSSISSATGTFDFEKIGTNLGVNSFEYFQELIVYNSDQSTNRSDIETNINDHYSIY